MKKLTYLFLAILIIACSDDEGNPCVYSPTLVTDAATNVTETTANLNGVISIVSENCDNPTNTEQGFVYATTTQPTTANNKINVNGTNINTTLENLEPNTTYYTRTFLTNVFGEFYGNEVSFMTAIPQSGLSFSTAFNFESNAISGIARAGMTGSYTDNSIFIATREDELSYSDRILKFNLDTSNITETLFDSGDYATKRIHVIESQLLVIGGQYITAYTLDLSGGDPTSVSHGKTLTRFGTTTLNDNVYIIGGDLNNIEAEKIFSWNIETNTLADFSLLPEFKFGADGTIVNDNLYVFGGTITYPPSASPSSTTAYKININNPSNVETFQIEQAIDIAFVEKFQNLIYVAGQIYTKDENNEVISNNPTVGVYNTLDNTYQELSTNLNNTSGFETIHQMCILNGKMYIIYGESGVDNGGQFNEWEVLVSDLN